jgi:pyrimidine-nucleoside phosphorylase
MESIPGYRTNLTREEFLAQLKSLGLVLTGQTSDLAPADGKLYALRDVTGTVQSIPLIASSVMSKKIAAGAQAIVLDVKVGLGAFMQTLSEARQLARLMVAIGSLSGRQVVALLSDMNQPLGNAIGNALEVTEAVNTLHGKGPDDFTEHCLTVASQMLVLGKKAEGIESARLMAESALASGQAWQAFRNLVIAQGGDVNFVEHLELLPTAPLIETVAAPLAGHICAINAREIGETAVELGAGRARKTDLIDHAVGIVVHRKVGDFVPAGEALFTVYANRQDRLEAAKTRILTAYQWSDVACPPLPLFYDVIK